MEIVALPLPPVQTNAYLLLEPSLGEAVLFDAPLRAMESVTPHLEKHGCKISAVYITHGHWDHILDAHLFNDAGIPVYGHVEDRFLLDDPSVQMRFTLPGLKIHSAKLDGLLTHGQELTILGRSVEVRHVPGHSPGSILFWFKNEKLVIGGDVLFNGSIGRTDFPGCSFDLLAKSIKEQIYPMPDNTVIYPGHGPSTTVGAEATGNPFVRR